MVGGSRVLFSCLSSTASLCSSRLLLTVSRAASDHAEARNTTPCMSCNIGVFAVAGRSRHRGWK